MAGRRAASWPDRAQQQVVDDPAPPEQVDLPGQQAGRGPLAGRAVPVAASRAAVSRSAGPITLSPHLVTSTSVSPAADAAAAIWRAVMAMLGCIPKSRSWVRPEIASAGVTGHRWTEISDMLSTPPGRSTR